MTDFDPNSPPGEGGGIFGLPHTERDAALVLLPVPWEATTSYGGGTSKGPAAMLAASAQIDLYDVEVERPYEPGIFMRPESARVRAWNKTARAAAQKVLTATGRVKRRPPPQKALDTANALGDKLNGWVADESRKLMSGGKIVGVVGGDHSVPFGAFQAAAELHGEFGILHFDAHSDTRAPYGGLIWSHASIMRNALERIPAIIRLTQVGVRDYCEAEQGFLSAQGQRVKVFFDQELAARRFSGRGWSMTASEIVETLPEKVWISFDIDGLDPALCPHTGTPVPGGLQFQEAVHLVARLASSGRTILGFDLVEVAPAPGGRDEWDANVGMRLLYKLAVWTFVSRGLRRSRCIRR